VEQVVVLEPSTAHNNNSNNIKAFSQASWGRPASVFVRPSTCVSRLRQLPSRLPHMCFKC
jgi:hypothetical protein